MLTYYSETNTLRPHYHHVLVFKYLNLDPALSGGIATTDSYSDRTYNYPKLKLNILNHHLTKLNQGQKRITVFGI